MHPLPVDRPPPLAGAKARTMGLENVLPVTAGTATRAATVFLFSVPKADKFFSAAMANQAVWLPAAEMVPPLVTALVAAKNLALATRRVREWFATIFT